MKIKELEGIEGLVVHPVGGFQSKNENGEPFTDIIHALHFLECIDPSGDEYSIPIMKCLRFDESRQDLVDLCTKNGELNPIRVAGFTSREKHKESQTGLWLEVEFFDVIGVSVTKEQFENITDHAS